MSSAAVRLAADIRAATRWAAVRARFAHFGELGGHCAFTAGYFEGLVPRSALCQARALLARPDFDSVPVRDLAAWRAAGCP